MKLLRTPQNCFGATIGRFVVDSIRGLFAAETRDLSFLFLNKYDNAMHIVIDNYLEYEDTMSKLDRSRRTFLFFITKKGIARYFGMYRFILT